MVRRVGVDAVRRARVKVREADAIVRMLVMLYRGVFDDVPQARRQLKISYRFFYSSRWSLGWVERAIE